MRSAAVDLLRNGTLLKYRTFSAFDSGGTYFYHVEVVGVTGLGFSIARQEDVRNAFADLAGFLHHDIRDEGDRFGKRKGTCCPVSADFLISAYVPIVPLQGGCAKYRAAPVSSTLNGYHGAVAMPGMGTKPSSIESRRG